MANKSFLDSIQTPSPCKQDWNEMIGGEQIRFCQNCEKTVYNLSVMPRGKAGKFAAQNAGKICVRYVRLPNGKVQTADMKLYKIAGRASRLAAGVLGAPLTLSVMVNAQTQSTPKSPKETTKKSQDRNYSKTSRISFTVYDQTGTIILEAIVILTNQKTKPI